METAGKKTLVFGCGISGIGAVKLLEEQKAEVILYDGNEKLRKEEIRKSLGEGTKAEIILGGFPEEILSGLSLMVLSPGVPTDLPAVRKAREMGVPVIGEVEFAYKYGKGDVLAITGTNGKTTTTTLLGEILKNYRGEDVFVVGNIGNPYT
ncbi:MAG TPA: UDP-N-acetylmuramoyl-L-alanine--D-glutamate ligase, partial [Lachnospiraceae bacterium]|nr:UDP-N-acetylmuramoyl-L-alanine--D-glutamate ligase [Lachnospiraceae bacterium]